MGDFLGGHAFGEALEDLAFAGGEAGDLFFLGFDGLFEALNEEAGDVLAEGGAAFAGLADAGGDVGGAGGFEEVAVGAGAEGGEDFFGVVVNGEDDEGGGGHVGGEMLDHLHAGGAGEFEVHDDDVGLVFEEDDGGFGAFKGAGGGEGVFLFLEEFFEEEAEGGVVLDDGDAEVPAAGSGGITGGRRRAHGSSIL